MDAMTISRFEQERVPRYTSYPTALQFAKVDGDGQARRWLAEVPRAMPLSLYLHVPFCRQLCWYCGCNTKVSRQDEPVDAYMAAILGEIELVTGVMGDGRPVAHLHWGGGTPTIAGADGIEGVMAALGRRFRFLPDAELAIEIDPRRLDPGLPERLGELGFGRASLGVQSLDPVVQRAINRIQPFEMVERGIERLRAAGIRRINLDLLYGLPHMTARSCAEGVDKLLDLEPDRLSVFGYAHVPWMRPNQRVIDEATLPGAAERVDQFLAIAERLEGAGYVRIGLDHFARPGDPLSEALAAGRLHRNFQGYTTDAAEALIGLGASAIGSTPSGYLQNHADVAAWTHAIKGGHLPIARAVQLTADDRVRRRIIECVMCYGRVDLDRIEAEEGAQVPWPAERLQSLATDGVIRIDGRTIEVRPDRRLLLRSVAAAFDAYLDPEAQRHSASL